MPLFKLLPGRPRRTFSSLTAFLGGICFFLGAEAYVRVVVKEMKNLAVGAEERLAVLAAGR